MEFFAQKGSVKTLFLNLRLILGISFELSKDKMVALLFLVNKVILLSISPE